MKEYISYRDCIFGNGKFRFSAWRDGTRQFTTTDDEPLYVERVARCASERKGRSRRTKWYIVRRPEGRGANTLYPPAVAGPFPSARSALAAMVMLLN